MKFFLLLTAAVVAYCISLAQAQTTAADTKLDVEKQIADLDRRLQEAVAIGDVGLLEQHVGEDLVFTHGWLEGGKETKRDWIDKAKKEPRLYFFRKVSSQVVEMHGNVAIVSGRLDVRGLPLAKNGESGPMCFAVNYVHVYVLRDQVWKFVSHRSSPMIEPAHPCP